MTLTVAIVIPLILSLIIIIMAIALRAYGKHCKELQAQINAYHKKIEEILK